MKLTVPVIGILRGVEPDFFPSLLQASFQAGLQAVEVTMNTPGAPEMLQQNMHQVPEGCLLGMGTVCNLDEAKVAIDAGAMFLVTPNTDVDVIAYAKWSGKRFPTPNEWEKAAFGEDGLMFPWGDEYSPKLCNILESNIGATTPVGSHSPAGDSPYGICDLFGNVWEWVYDWTASPQNRMLMGGAWDTPLEYLLPPYYARVRANPGLAGKTSACGW